MPWTECYNAGYFGFLGGLIAVVIGFIATKQNMEMNELKLNERVIDEMHRLIDIATRINIRVLELEKQISTLSVRKSVDDSR